MATLTQIFNLRIKINDPPDIIRIVSIANYASLPTTAKNQTAYYVSNDADYYVPDRLTDVQKTDYQVQSLFLSNNVLSDLIDTHGAAKAVYKAIYLIMSKLSNKLLMVRNTNGTESVEYITLLNLQRYYRNLLADLKEDAQENAGNSTGRGISMKTPTIAGGNL